MPLDAYECMRSYTTAYQAAIQQPTGSRFGADAIYNGENRGRGAIMSYYLKIDKSFVDHITNNKTDQAMVKSIISMGKNLDMRVLAEGVETAEHAAILKQSGCDLFGQLLILFTIFYSFTNLCFTRNISIKFR